MRPVLRFLPSSGALLLLCSLVVGCSGDEGPEADPGHQPTPLSSFDADTVRIARADFCSGFSDEVLAAHVGEVRRTAHYGNGENTDLTEDVTDVSHEFNCTFVGADGRVARAWVFVPQVPRARASDLVADARKDRAGCTPLSGGGFGDPATSSICRTEDESRVTFQGLFVDAWLSCSLSVPDPRIPAASLRTSAGQWCVAAARAAQAPAASVAPDQTP